ncbi:MAG: pyrroline-5-carboxylate reductase [Novosphingobium sp.]|nr:pyrroline-5-carboxylate reductase [Novosphingobium sp.]
MEQWPASLLLVGCGNMGGAMLAGWIAGGIAPSRFTVVDPFLDAAPDGVELLRDLPVGMFDAILLGVKPQMLGEVAPQLAALARGDTLVFSILAGVELESLAGYFPQASGLVRIMPNLSAAIGKSPITLAHRGLSQAQQTAVIDLMSSLGTPEWIEESRFDLVTALAGSGPAFVYRFIDALASGAANLGLDPAQAERLALATVEGAALLAAGSEIGPGELARRVASPGGTTQAGLDVLDAEAALARLVESTLQAACNRSAEMAKEIRN